MADSTPSIDEARAFVAAANAEVEAKRQAHAEANAAGWRAHEAYQAAVAHAGAMKVQLDQLTAAEAAALAAEAEDAPAAE